MKRKKSFNLQEKHVAASLLVPSSAEVHLYPLNIHEQFANLKKLSEQLLHYAAIIESSHDAIYTLSLSGVITSWNKGAEKLFDYKASEIVGKHVSILLPENQPFEIEKFHDLLRNNKKEQLIESERLRRDGSIVSVLITISVMRDMSGRAVGASVISRDITKRKKALASLAENRHLMQTIFDQAPVGITLVDSNLNFVMLNTFFRRMLKYSEKALKEKGFINITHPDDQAKSTENLQQLFSGKLKHSDIEKRYVTKEGKIVWTHLRAAVISGPNDSPRYILGLIEDITTRRELERQKDEFISIAAHELKTPVTTLKAYAQILQKRLGASGKAKESYIINNINAQADKLTRLITDLLNVNRISAGKLVLTKKKFDLDALLKKIVIDFQYTVDSHVIQLEGKVGRMVYGDENRIEEVIMNLVTNAVKYSPRADTVIVTVRQNGSNAEVCVRDFGPGISKKNREKLFERFYRAQINEHDQSSGFGLGLYISKEIVSQHGGRIWVENPKVGTKFCFIIPLRKGKQVSV